MRYWDGSFIRAARGNVSDGGVFNLRAQHIYKAAGKWISIVTSGLVLHVDAGNSSSYPGSGTTWTDLSGQSIDGTLTNGPTYSSADGGAIVFDGSNDHIAFNSQLDPVADGLFADSSSAWSVSSWFNPDNAGGSDTVINSKAGGTGSAATYATFVSGGNVKVRLRGGTVATVASVSNGNWYEIAVTWDGSTAKAYLNGVFQTNVAVGSVAKQTDKFKIAAANDSPHQFFDGKVSATTVYDRALTAAEVTQNYNALKGRYGL